MSLPARSAPQACTMSRQGEIAETPARAQPSISSTNDHAFTVIELIESSARSCERSRITRGPILSRHARESGHPVTRERATLLEGRCLLDHPLLRMMTPREPHVYASRLHAARRQHGAHAQRRAVGIGDEARCVGEAEQLGEMQGRARALLAADQGEMIL